MIYKKDKVLASSNEQTLVKSIIKWTVTLFLEMAIEFIWFVSRKTELTHDRVIKFASFSVGFYGFLFEAVKIAPVKI
jgi:hypothetical protein